MPEAIITVEVVYAAVDRQLLCSLDVPAGTTVRQALLLSGIGADFPELDLAKCTVGIFGKVVANAELRILRQGDRIEIYRPLLADPKETRRLRAVKAAKARQIKEQG